LTYEGIPVGYLNYTQYKLMCVCVCVLDRNYNRFPKQGRAERIDRRGTFYNVHLKHILRACTYRYNIHLTEMVNNIITRL